MCKIFCLLVSCDAMFYFVKHILLFSGNDLVIRHHTVNILPQPLTFLLILFALQLKTSVLVFDQLFESLSVKTFSSNHLDEHLQFLLWRIFSR